MIVPALTALAIAATPPSLLDHHLALGLPAVDLSTLDYSAFARPADRAASQSDAEMGRPDSLRPGTQDPQAERAASQSDAEMGRPDSLRPGSQDPQAERAASQSDAEMGRPDSLRPGTQGPQAERAASQSDAEMGRPDSLRPGTQGPGPLTVGLVSVGMASIVLIAGAAAWWNRGFDTFRFNDTGMFGRDTYSGGADKLGHFYCTYVSMSAMTPIYEHVGIGHDGAILGATIFTLLLWNGFEVIDGFTEYGVEYGDVIMNTLGIGLGAAMQYWPTLPRLIGVRLGYVPSRAFLDNDKSVLKFINDYAGMLYYLDVKLKGVLELSGLEPGFGRYFIGGLVFGTDAYSPVRDDARRRRSFGLHLGLSLSEVLRAFGDGDKGVEIFARFFDFYAVPFLNVAVMKDLNGDGWFVNFGVANRSEIRLDR